MKVRQLGMWDQSSEEQRSRVLAVIRERETNDCAWWPFAIASESKVPYAVVLDIIECLIDEGVLERINTQSGSVRLAR